VGLGLTQFLLLHSFLRSANRKLYENPNHPVRQRDLMALAEAQRGRFAQQQRENLRTSIEARESTGNGHEKQPSEDLKQLPRKQATRRALDSAANSVGRHDLALNAVDKERRSDGLLRVEHMDQHDLALPAAHDDADAATATAARMKMVPSLSAKNDPLMEPIIRAGKLYSIGRKDRSGSVISDMLYAHAFAFAHNVTYAGACFTVWGLPKKDTLQLLEKLQWSNFLPFACPPGVDSSLNLFKPNATELSPLMLNDDVYRWKLIHTDYFSPAWRQSIQRAIADDNPRARSIASQHDRPYEIAVHVRRGDVTPCRYKRRYLTNEHYLKLIDQYTPSPEARDNRPVHVTIYSESISFESFDVFRERNYTVDLDSKDLAVIWKALATADLVIMSRSFFSFVPAAVNPNTVVATDFFEFEPLAGWIQADEALVKETDKQIRIMAKEKCPKENAGIQPKPK